MSKPLHSNCYAPFTNSLMREVHDVKRDGEGKPVQFKARGVAVRSAQHQRGGGEGPMDKI